MKLVMVLLKKLFGKKKQVEVYGNDKYLEKYIQMRKEVRRFV